METDHQVQDAQFMRRKRGKQSTFLGCVGTSMFCHSQENGGYPSKYLTISFSILSVPRRPMITKIASTLAKSKPHEAVCSYAVTQDLVELK